MTSTARVFDYITCPTCGRRVGAYVPVGNDGTTRVLARHGLKKVHHGRVEPCPDSGSPFVRDRVTGTGWKRPE